MRLMLSTLVILASTVAAAANLAITSEPYLTGGVFTNPVLPLEGQETTITIRATVTGELSRPPEARITITDATGNTRAEEALTLTVAEGAALGAHTWSSPKNGLFTIRVDLDPNNKIAEEDEDDNTAQIMLPILVEGRPLHFPWYREVPLTRWATCITSTGEDARARLTERGVLPLNWEYGGMSWSYYDKEKAETHPEEVLAEIEQVFYEKFNSSADVIGFGIDECGGYPGTFKYYASIASMKGLVRARREQPDRFYAVWNGGGPRPEIAALCRQGADLLLLETYLWRALPDELGTEDIYESLVSRVEPYIRATDMFQPAYGNRCYTLLALDTSERPDRIDLGEQEQVIRFIRRTFPEMRGLAWYNGGYGSYGLERTEETDRHHDAVLVNADRLCFEYFVKPCLTFMDQALWLTPGPQDKVTLTAAVSNLGAIDARAIEVTFYIDGKSIGRAQAEAVPAGPNRNQNRVILKKAISPRPGPHTFEARITRAPNATILDPIAQTDRFINH